MSRSLEAWEGKTDDTAIPDRVKKRIYRKAEGKCAICGLKIEGKLRPAFDHIQAIINGGANSEHNLQMLCMSPCHAKKTRADVAIKKKNERVMGKHIGLKKPRKITRWRRFDGTIRDAGRERS